MRASTRDAVVQCTRRGLELKDESPGSSGIEWHIFDFGDRGHVCDEQRAKLLLEPQVGTIGVDPVHL